MQQPDSDKDYLTHYFDLARYKWIFAFSISIFLVFFLLAFQPFGVNNFDPEFHISLQFVLIVSAFGLVVLTTLTINEFVLRPLIIKQLTRTKVICWLLWTVLMVATVVFVFYNFIGEWHDLSWSSYLGFIADISMLLALPISGFVFFIRHESLKSEFVELKSIQMGRPAARLMHFSSDNDKDKIAVALDDLLYLESQDNYVTVVYQDDHNNRSSLIRSSLKRLEDIIDEPLVLRCHRSFIVNLHKVKYCNGNRHGLKLGIADCDREIPVSRTYTASILQKLESV